MKDLKSLFSFEDKPEVKDDANIKLTGDRARACLSTKEFKHYRDQYAALEEKVIDELIKEAANFCISGDSIEKFGAKCLVKLTRLRDLRSLITKIQIDAQKGKDNGKHEN